MGPFDFVWGVDQDGYKIERVSGGSLMFGVFLDFDAVAPVGGPLRYYRPLRNDGLWLQFAERCRTTDGALRFANEYGGLTSSINERGVICFSQTPLDEFFKIAERLWGIAGHIRNGDRAAAANLLRDDGFALSLPLMRVMLVPAEKRPGAFEYRLVPQSLRDALLFQAAEAITGNRRFQRCRNEECSNWFRLGPHLTSEGQKTHSIRREFCSDRCRVASARKKQRMAANA